MSRNTNTNHYRLHIFHVGKLGFGQHVYFNKYILTLNMISVQIAQINLYQTTVKLVYVNLFI